MLEILLLQEFDNTERHWLVS